MLKFHKIQVISWFLSRTVKSFSGHRIHQIWPSNPNYTDVSQMGKVKCRSWRLPIGEFIRRSNNRKKVFVTSRSTTYSYLPVNFFTILNKWRSFCAEKKKRNIVKTNQENFYWCQTAPLCRLPSRQHIRKLSRLFAKIVWCYVRMECLT